MHPPGQVVDLPTPLEEKRPDDAKFVSEHDSTVTKETKKYGRFEDHARQGDREGTASMPQKPSAPRRPPPRHAHARSRPVPAHAGPVGRAGPRRAPGGVTASRTPARRPRADPGAGRGGLPSSRAASSRRGSGPRSSRPSSSWRARSAAARRMPSTTSTTATRPRSTPSAGASLVLQPRQAPGGRALAPGRGLPPAQSDRRGLRATRPLHGAAGPAQARRTAEQRRAGAAERPRVPGRRGDRGVQGGGAVPEPAAPAHRGQRAHQLRLRLPVRSQRTAPDALVPLQLLDDILMAPVERRGAEVRRWGGKSREASMLIGRLL